MYRKKSRDKSAMKIKKITVLSYFFLEISKKNKKKGQVNYFPKFNGYFGDDNLLPMSYNIQILKKVDSICLSSKVKYFGPNKTRVN